MGATSFDIILEDYVGGFGRYQILNTLVINLVTYCAFYPILYYIFTAYQPPHRCRIPLCESENQTKISSNIYNADWLNFTIPPETSSTNYFDKLKKFDGCTMYPSIQNVKFQENLQSCSAKMFDQNIDRIVPCEDYIYDNTYFDETLATNLDLVCDKESLVGWLGTIQILAAIFGAILGGKLGDKFGRKNACFIAILILAPAVSFGGFVTSYHAYAILHSITSICLPIIMVNQQVYSTELYTSKYRLYYMILNNKSVPFMVTALIVYFSRTWTDIHIRTGILIMCTLPFYFAIPESPRWLAQNGKEDMAMKILVKMAKVNKRELNPSSIAKIKDIVHDIADEQATTRENLTPLDMFKHGQLVKTLVIILAWITVCTSAYALGLNSTSLSGHIVFNFLLSRITALPVTIMMYFTVNRFGRVNTLGVSHIMLGIGCLGLAFIPKEQNLIAVLPKNIFVIVIYFVANMFVGLSFSLVYLVTAESYPTNLRAQAVGTSSTVARIFCAVAPFLGQLARYWKPLPSTILGIPLIISGLLTIWKVPETLNSTLPQTLKKRSEIQENKIIAAATDDVLLRELEPLKNRNN